LVLEPIGQLDARFTTYAVNGRVKFAIESTGVPQLTAPQVRKYLVAAPTLREQRAIATALDDVDALLGGLDRLIAKKRDLKQAAMQQLLTGQTRLTGFRGEWEVKPLGQIVSTSITDGPHLTPKFLADGVPFLSVNNLVNNKIDLQSLRFVSKADHLEFSKKCKPQKGDILFGKAASVGMVGLIETDMELNIWSPLALIRVGHPTSARFVCYALQASHVHRQIKLLTNASSQGNIGMGEIGLLEIPLPEPDEQTAIATVLSDMDAEVSALEARRVKTHDLKQAMMQELLTGRTRLV
jgi:type I restriction enzyme S subunit